MLRRDPARSRELRGYITRNGPVVDPRPALASVVAIDKSNGFQMTWWGVNWVNNLPICTYALSSDCILRRYLQRSEPYSILSTYSIPVCVFFFFLAAACARFYYIPNSSFIEICPVVVTWLINIHLNIQTFTYLQYLFYYSKVYLHSKVKNLLGYLIANT